MKRALRIKNYHVMLMDAVNKNDNLIIRTFTRNQGSKLRNWYNTEGQHWYSVFGDKVKIMFENNNHTTEMLEFKDLTFV